MPQPSQSCSRRRIAVLGSTGSIGVNCLDVAAHLPERIEVVALCARANWQTLFEQTQRFHPRWAVLVDSDAARQVDKSRLWPETEFLVGEEAVARIVSAPDVDLVLSAIVGAAGLFGTWRALEAGKTVALANKETLVMAGAQVMPLAALRNARILPVDSEHSAIFQAIGDRPTPEIARLVLTGSGGPFRGKKRRELQTVTPEQALNHPTWRMGPKITVDSATLMNKALEVIEARWLFGVPPEKIDVVIHPQSLVHSFVEFVDGSILAQLSPPDMRLPIQYALTWPERVSGPARRLNWQELSCLQFEPPDHETFPALQLGYEVARRGGTCGAVLNAANEEAVQRFLQGTLNFLDIPSVCREVLDQHYFSANPSLEELLAADRQARVEVARWTRTSPRFPSPQPIKPL
ncbi:MAG TPA: 1-deoxy-D-xylulose-5-phosphate reductoisomerase [Gemmataceae bacterium]|nr:1-deoxy-D-xylulose-5-phosphate reductoisomerase [Gemmataceae bacterium]